jgi:hypothetical protein
MLKCPYCDKPIPGSLVTARAGQLGGKKTARRGPEYFRQLEAKRRTKGGGRPPKEVKPT